MPLINFAAREINYKIVYYGCGLCGKTTNLQYIHRKINPDARGKLVSIATEEERTLYFDFLPLTLGTVKGMQTRFHLYTVPGQSYYNASRKLVLQGVDGVIFVADSQITRLDENVESYLNLWDNLLSQGDDLSKLGFVIQMNKRDLTEVFSVEDLNELLNHTDSPVTESSAVTGQGDGATTSWSRRPATSSPSRTSGPSCSPAAPPPHPPPRRTAATRRRERPLHRRVPRLGQDDRAARGRTGDGRGRPEARRHRERDRRGRHRRRLRARAGSPRAGALRWLHLLHAAVWPGRDDPRGRGQVPPGLGDHRAHGARGARRHPRRGGRPLLRAWIPSACSPWSTPPAGRC